MNAGRPIMACAYCLGNEARYQGRFEGSKQQFCTNEPRTPREARIGAKIM